MKKGNQKSDIIASHGRRKEAVARVKLYKGDGQILVNEQPINQYFPSEVARTLWQKPFILTKSQKDYSATIKVSFFCMSSKVLFLLVARFLNLP